MIDTSAYSAITQAKAIAAPDRCGRPAPVIAIAAIIRKYGFADAKVVVTRCSIGYPGSWLTHCFDNAVSMVVGDRIAH